MSALRIDIDSWERKEIYEHFRKTPDPFWSITYEEDVTDVLAYTRRNHLSFYTVMIWTVVQALNQIQAFRYTIRDQEVYLLEKRYPSFTYLKKNSDQFQIATVSADTDDLFAFCKTAETIMQEQTEFLNESKETDELVFISCLPWIHVTGLTNEGMTDPDDCIPRIAWGKYHTEHGKTSLGISFEVNHRFIDGLHIGMFHEAFQKTAQSLNRTML